MGRLFTEGWNAFITEIRDFNDGFQECGAELQATFNMTNITTTYYGHTNGGHGHAEIDGV
jgi:hypothetical protein